MFIEVASNILPVSRGLNEQTGDWVTWVSLSCRSRGVILFMTAAYFIHSSGLQLSLNGIGSWVWDKGSGW